MQRIPIVENVFCHTHKQLRLSHVTVADPVAVTRADFTRTSVTLPSDTGQSNYSIPTEFLLSAPKEVFISKCPLEPSVDVNNFERSLYPLYHNGYFCVIVLLRFIVCTLFYFYIILRIFLLGEYNSRTSLRKVLSCRL